MSDELDVLKLVARRLGDAGIAYMLSGSMALNYDAQPRMTRDIDVVIELGPRDAERLAGLFATDFLCEVEAVRQRGTFNIIHNELLIKVDFIVRKDSPYRREELARRRQVAIEDATISLVAAEDLLLSKLVWAKESRSELQLRDARNLIAAVPQLDWGYIEHWAEDLSVTELLAEARS